MTNDTAVFVFLVILAITVIPISLWTVFVISRETDTVIYRCESMKRWAKRNLDEREGGQE